MPATSDLPPGPPPLSPHISIYRWSWTMMMSIAHRISGLGLYAVMGGVILWLAALAQGGDLAAGLSHFFRHPVGQFFLFFAAWAFWHHLLGGVRHLFWDIGFFFDPLVANRLAAAHFFLAAALNFLFWLFVWFGG